MTSPAVTNRTAEAAPGRMRQEPAAADAFDPKLAIVTVTAALALTLQNYGRSPETLAQVLGGLRWLASYTPLADALAYLEGESASPLGGLLWWGLVCLATYFVLPALVIRFVLRERLRDYGLKRAGSLAGLPVYLVLLALVLPLVVLVSADAQFQQTYPFYPVPSRERLGPHFWCWELLYAAQFIALEFFFRGFLVLGTRHRFGLHAVLFMMVPYCMLHFGKPMLEALASIIAGGVLGWMSYRTRSIWLGAAAHVTVAWSMDLAVLCRKGFWP